MRIFIEDEYQLFQIDQLQIDKEKNLILFLDRFNNIIGAFKENTELIQKICDMPTWYKGKKHITIDVKIQCKSNFSYKKNLVSLFHERKKYNRRKQHRKELKIIFDQEQISSSREADLWFYLTNDVPELDSIFNLSYYNKGIYIQSQIKDRMQIKIDEEQTKNKDYEFNIEDLKYQLNKVDLDSELQNFEFDFQDEQTFKKNSKNIIQNNQYNLRNTLGYNKNDNQKINIFDSDNDSQNTQQESKKDTYDDDYLFDTNFFSDNLY